MSLNLLGKIGFTLIELMIVIAIIGTLAGIGIPSYNRFITNTRNQNTIFEIQVIASELVQYEALNEEFPENLSELGPDIPLDRWGNPYQYTRVAGAKIGELRKDKNLVPVNTDFDLYSMGADGKSKKPFTTPMSKDDIVRANNGEFVGLVSDY